MAVFVVGREGRFQVGSVVIISPSYTYRNPDDLEGKERVMHERFNIHGASRFLNYVVPMRRGKAVETHAYARKLPEDAEPGLAQLDREIAEKEVEIKALRAARQAFLAAHVVRGEVISKKHATEITREERAKLEANS